MSPEASQAAPPAGDGAALRQLIMGFRATQMIHVAARLGIADHLREGPQTADTLAQAVGAAPRPLYRLLRALKVFVARLAVSNPAGLAEVSRALERDDFSSNRHPALSL